MNEFLNANQRDNFLSTLPVIHRTVSRFRRSDPQMENEDIAHDVIVGLLTWKRNRPDRNFSLTEWVKMARRAARNRVFRFRPPRAVTILPLSEPESPFSSSAATFAQQTLRADGNTNMELHTIVTEIWKIVKAQSFLENYALLLKNDELTLHLVLYRECGLDELGVLLQLTGDELKWILRQLPLSDLDISEFLRDTFEIVATPVALRKARQRAKSELQSALKIELRTGRR